MTPGKVEATTKTRIDHRVRVMTALPASIVGISVRKGKP